MKTKTQLKVGDAAPDFTLLDHNGEMVRHSSFSSSTLTMMYRKLYLN